MTGGTLGRNEIISFDQLLFVLRKSNLKSLMLYMLEEQFLETFSINSKSSNQDDAGASILLQLCEHNSQVNRWCKLSRPPTPNSCPLSRGHSTHSGLYLNKVPCSLQRTSRDVTSTGTRAMTSRPFHFSGVLKPLTRAPLFSPVEADKNSLTVQCSVERKPPFC